MNKCVSDWSKCYINPPFRALFSPVENGKRWKISRKIRHASGMQGLKAVVALWMLLPVGVVVDVVRLCAVVM